MRQHHQVKEVKAGNKWRDLLMLTKAQRERRFCRRSSWFRRTGSVWFSVFMPHFWCVSRILWWILHLGLHTNCQIDGEFTHRHQSGWDKTLFCKCLGYKSPTLCVLTSKTLNIIQSVSENIFFYIEMMVRILNCEGDTSFLRKRHPLTSTSTSNKMTALMQTHVMHLVSNPQLRAHVYILLWLKPD